MTSITYSIAQLHGGKWRVTHANLPDEEALVVLDTLREHSMPVRIYSVRLTEVSSYGVSRMRRAIAQRERALVYKGKTLVRRNK